MTEGLREVYNETAS